MDPGPGGRGHLVTGASRGLGSAAARALVTDGARVPVTARSSGAVDAAVAALGRAAFRLCPAASSVSGTTVAVDGGRPRTP